jgi:hypothetical protein
MPQINEILQPQYYEIIRDRIVDILFDELLNQYTIGYDDDFNVAVTGERFVAIGLPEVPIINVSLANGNFDNKHIGFSDGAYTFNIDVYSNSSTEDGDRLSTIHLHKLLGACRAILENPAYKTLGFNPGFIRRVGVQGFDIAEQRSNDSRNNAMGRLVFNVSATEYSPFKEPELIAGMNTEVKISDSEVGFLYVMESY